MQWTQAEARLLRALPRDGTAVALAHVTQAAGFTADAQTLAAAERPLAQGIAALEEKTDAQYALSPEGLRYRDEGLPERRALESIRGAGGRLPLAELSQVLPKHEATVAIGWLKRKGWADIEKQDGAPTLVATAAAGGGPDEEALAALDADPAPLADHAEGLALLRGRGGILVEEEHVERSLRLTDASVLEGLPDDVGADVTQITPDLVARWEGMTAEERAAVTLRPFAMDAEVAPRLPGKPHPLSQLMLEVRRIFWQMGFGEIRGDYVESAFWNMDALFIPQDHPARDLQDTFYLADPARIDVAEEDLRRGRAVHEHGGDTGSKGWGGTFDDDVARQALLRTHTTNTTVRYLARHFHGVADAEPVHRVFGLGRVFRNETMDATHLPEFHQIEGIVTEPDASFDMLVGLCRHFFTALGFPQVRFRPAYFPYTEPSMEIEVHYGGRWMELGGCGVFRPEVTGPLDVPHPVLAWGFGLERLAMMRLGLKDIRQLYLPDLEWLQKRPLL